MTKKKIKATIDRFEGGFAVVQTEFGSVDIPKDMLPETTEGDVIYINISKDEEETKSQEELAKALLNEVLKEE